MSHLRWIKQSVRRSVLATINRRSLRSAIRSVEATGRTPIFFIFTEQLLHFAPYCLPPANPQFLPVFLLNGVSPSHYVWLKTLYPGLPVVRLRASLTGRSQNLIPHSEVIDDLLHVCNAAFCLQDPDCFITDPAFLDKVRLRPESEFAAGPFTKRPTHKQHVLPDTFFLMLDPCVHRRLNRTLGVTPHVTTQLNDPQKKAIEKLGYKPGEFPEQFKGNFDTLQVFWLIALSEGLTFHELPGSGSSVFHIGGTSYLHQEPSDLSHWDYWPLSVQYINLRLLEMPTTKHLQELFPGLRRQYQNADDLLAKFPAFKDGYRYRDIHTILDKCVLHRTGSIT